MNTVENTVGVADVATVTVNVKGAKRTKVVKRGVGRPEVPVKLIMNKGFTLKQLADVNPGVKAITLRAHVLRALADGTLVPAPKTVKTGLRGKPAHIYINSKVQKAANANLAKVKRAVKAKASVVTEALGGVVTEATEDSVAA